MLTCLSLCQLKHLKVEIQDLFIQICSAPRLQTEQSPQSLAHNLFLVEAPSVALNTFFHPAS